MYITHKQKCVCHLFIYIGTTTKKGWSISSVMIYDKHARRNVNNITLKVNDKTRQYNF